MRRAPGFGLALAAFGALVLTPDTLFMRLSEMGGFQMVAWRGCLMGAVMILGWALLSRDRGAELARLTSAAGLVVVVCQFLGVVLFALAIAVAPVAVVLFGLATVPLCAALLSRVILGEPTPAATWAAMGAVMAGIGIAVLGDTDAALRLDPGALSGALLGLGVALVMALNLVVLRARPLVPIPLAIGLGGLGAGLLGLAVTGLAAMPQGHPWAIVASGAVITPLSFFALSLAVRHTQAANVSLLMLVETVLGPLWVWLGVGERPTLNMGLGGAIVVVSLGLYLIVTGRRLRRPQMQR